MISMQPWQRLQRSTSIWRKRVPSVPKPLINRSQRRELMSVPDDLRNVLEQCLAEDATPDNLELYLPTVRQIITNLLQGLRGKQSIYRRIVADHRHRSSEQPGHERTESRSARSDRTSRREGGSSTHRSQLSRTAAENERENANRKSAQSSGKRRDPDSPQNTSAPLVNGDEPFVGGFVASVPENAPARASIPVPPPPPPPVPVPDSNDLREPAQPQPRRQRSTPGPPPNELAAAEAPVRPSSVTNLHPAADRADLIPPPTPPPSQVPASVRRYSLVDNPVTPPSVIVDEPSSPGDNAGHDRNGSSSPPPDTPPLDATQAPAMANSLAALKKSDALERRASKRFSTYNISKMTGGTTTRERSTRSQTNRRSLAASSALTPGELAVLTEVDEPEPALRREGSSRSRTRSASRPSTPDRNQTPPVPPLPSTPAKTPEPPAIVAEPSSAETTQTTAKVAPVEHAEPSVESSRITVFLQLGREVKKATIEPGLSFSSLRMLFVDRFSYNPGLENFPAIYIRDPSSGVQYELEDMDEVKEKCLLSLNIERK